MAIITKNNSYRRRDWQKLVMEPDWIVPFPPEVDTQWIPNSYTRLETALNIYGRAKISGWNGTEFHYRYSQMPIGQPDEPWKWHVREDEFVDGAIHTNADQVSTLPVFFTITKKNKLRQVAEPEARKWWSDILPILVNEMAEEEATRSRWWFCVDELRSEMAEQVYTAFVLNNDGELISIPDFIWRSMDGLKIVHSGYADFILSKQNGVRRVSGMVLFSKGFLDNKPPKQMNKSPILDSSVDPLKFPYLDFMYFAAQNAPFEENGRTSKKVLQNWIEINWPNNLGVPTTTKINNMATFLRKPQDERGGLHRKGKDN